MKNQCYENVDAENVKISENSLNIPRSEKERFISTNFGN